MYLEMDDEALRREAERLASLTPEGIRQEAVYRSLRLERQSEIAADELTQLDRKMLEEMFPQPLSPEP